MSSDVVQQARSQASEWTFVIQRLSAGLNHLKAKLDAVQAWLTEEARAEEEERVTKERDALAAELSQTYPVLAHQLADLLQRLEDHAKETAKVGVPDAETVARKLPGNGRIGGMPVSCLSRLLRLPAFDPSEEVRGQSIWPRPAQRPQLHGSLEIPRPIKRMAPQLAS